MQNIPVVIFCGGEGTRMRGGTLTKKELVEIGGRPIIWHVMRTFSHYGLNRFVLPLGYEAQQIKRYFLTYEAITRDFSINVGRSKNDITYHGAETHPEWDVSLIDTGLHTDKASRVARVADYLDSDRFFLTYGDGLADINLDDLVAFHQSHGKLVTVTAVQPKHYQYGIMEANETGLVSLYEQYPPLPYWINAGFMIFERKTLALMSNDADNVALETEILPQLIRQNEVMMYRHHGFWRSMDTLKDANELSEIWHNGAPWKVWT